MKVLTRLFVVSLLIMQAAFLSEETLRTSHGTHGVAFAFNDNAAACSIPTSEFVSLIQSINHAEESFLFGTEISVPRMWWGAILGLNNSLDEPLERKVLESTILQLREARRIIPELAVFLRIEEVRNERNAQDFFLLMSSLCQAGLITKAEIHTDSAIRRAHASLGDAYSTYLTPAESVEFWLETVSEAQNSPKEVRGLAHTYRLGDNLYLLKINSFLSQHVANDVRSALELVVSECTFPHIILDLRDNLGGFTEASVEVSRNFLRNQTIVQFENRDGLRELLVAGPTDNNFHFQSITVLVNQWTASGAEIVASALDENGAATVGSRTYGKAVGQHIQNLSNGGSSRITSFRVFSPLGNSWQDLGITPEVNPANSFSSLIDEEMLDELRSNLGYLFFDQGVVASYRLVRERESWDPRCGP